MSSAAMQVVSEEARILAEQFLNGAKTDHKADAPEAESTKPNILFALPCYGGQVHCLTTNLLMSLTRLLTKEDIPHETHFVVESLVPRARNHLASVAAFSNDQEGRPFSHILFIDADQSFDAGWILKMLSTNLPVVALPCSRKVLNLAMVAEAAKRNINPASLLAFAGSPVLAVNESFQVSDQPVPVVHVGTGVMMISVDKVLKPLAELHPERKYRPNVAYDKNVPWNFDFFRTGVRGESYLSEDYFFLEDVKNDLGIQPHVLPSAITLHAGLQLFEMNMLALASLHGVLGQEQAKAAQPAEG